MKGLEKETAVLIRIMASSNDENFLAIIVNYGRSVNTVETENLHLTYIVE